MCGGGKPPSQPTVDPAAERQAAADAAAKKANAAIINDRRRQRGQRGLLAGESDAQGTLLQRASTPKTASTRNVLMGT